MIISENDWNAYVRTLRLLSDTAANKLQAYIDKYGIDNAEAIAEYAHALITKYGEGSAELACQMYDAIANAEHIILPSAVPAAIATQDEVEKAILGSFVQSPLGKVTASIADRYVKLAAEDTMIKNAVRDRAEWAWVPHGDTCAFCITLASRGWQLASTRALRGGHAEHVHAHCDCQYMIRHDSKTTVKGYDPDVLLAEYNSYSGSPQDKINAMRREHYAENKDKINAQKREAYALKVAENKKNKALVQITDNAIKNIPLVSIPGKSLEFNEKIQSIHKLVLSEAKDNNTNFETAVIASKDLARTEIIYGTVSGVDIPKSTLGTNIFVAHNHPRNTSFSTTDIMFFVDREDVNIFSVVKNNGQVEIISKTSNYVANRFKTIYNRELKKAQNNLTETNLDKLVQNCLKAADKEGLISWQKN